MEKQNFKTHIEPQKIPQIVKTILREEKKWRGLETTLYLSLSFTACA